MAKIALKVENLSIRFGGLDAVSQLNFTVQEGKIFGLIGPNGAGKTTVFNMLTGIYRPTSGSIQVFGMDLVGSSPCEITHRGLARTFQNIRLFKNLSVLENILVASDQRPSICFDKTNTNSTSESRRPSVLSTIFRTKNWHLHCLKQQFQAQEYLEIFGLSHRESHRASQLSYGEQRRLEIARALATGAKVLLLDEPAAGMNSAETLSLTATIENVRKRFGVTVLFIEHDMNLVMKICERIIVLDHGVKIGEGTPKEIRNNPQVIEAYLGKAR